MFQHMINPVFLDFGFVKIYYYGLVYVIGFLFVLWYLLKLSDKKEISLSKDDVYDLVVYAFFGVLLGGRLGHIIFYNLSYYSSNLSEIVAVWNGGMSFHGGLIGTIIAVSLFCRKKKVSFYELADIVVVPVAFMVFIGRLANFVNGEIVGKLWDNALCVDYSQNPYLKNPPLGCRYPSQILEALKNLFIFGTLFFLKDLKFKKGTLFWSFITLYGLLRFFIEFIKDSPIIFLGLTMGQLLCSVMVVVGIIMLYRLNSK